MMDLAAIIQQAAILNNTQTAQAQEISSLMQGASKEASGVAENLQTAGKLSADAELTKLQGELNTQQARVKVANAFGTNANAQSDVLVAMGGLLRENAIQLINAQNQVSQIEANSDIVSNPLGWLTDLLEGDGARANRDALAAKFETTQGIVTGLNAATQTSVATQNAISETLTAKSIKDLAETKRLQAENDAAGARIDAAKYGVASIEALQALGADIFTRNLQMYNASEEAERWRVARADAQAARDEKKELAKDVEDMTSRINAYRTAFNLPPVNSAYIKRNWGSGKVGDMLRDQELAGWRILDNGGSTEGALGTKPSDAYFSVKSSDIKTPPAWKPSMDILDEAESTFNTAMSEIDPKTGKVFSESMTPEQARGRFDEIVKATAEGYKSRIVPGKGNPYEAPPIESVLSSPTQRAKALGTSRFAAAVLAPMVATGNTQPDPELMAATALTAAQKGDITLREAHEGIVTYYREAVGLKNASAGFTTMNIPPMEGYRIPNQFLVREGISPVVNIMAQTRFGVQLKQLSPEQKTISTVREIDLTNPADVMTMLTIMQSKETANSLLKEVKKEGSQ